VSYIARRHRHHVLAAILVGAFVVGVFGTAAANTSLHHARSPLPRITQLGAGRSIRITTLALTPKIQRTIHFTGYATYTFRAPRGRQIVSASARITGAEAHAVKIRRKTVSHSRTRYTVNLIFPGEQGNPGKLIVRLSTVA
jgi:hypothetical protein